GGRSTVHPQPRSVPKPWECEVFGYIVRRLIAGFLVIVATSVAVFALFFYGPSNPGQVVCQATSPRCPPERVADYNQTLGYNDPVTEQYVVWAKGLFTGRDIQFGSTTIDCPAPCLGISYYTREPVSELLKERYPATLSLAVGAAIIFLPLGVVLGSVAARKRGTSTDRLMVGSSLIIYSIPYYLLALMSYLYLVIIWGIFPQPEYNPFTENPWAWVSGLLLPWLVLGLAFSTQYARFSRGSMVESLSEDYVRTARAKGLTQRVVLIKHALRAAIVPVITIFGLDFASLLAGTVFTEFVFNIDGIGVQALNSIQDQNFPIISATALIVAVFVVVCNLAVDILYSVIDPRVRLT
ncbi:MAG: ABC transporter permease, partial [Nocardioidaceae bacterium]